MILRRCILMLMLLLELNLFKKRGPKERGSFMTREKAKDPKAKYPKKKFGSQAISIEQRKARLKQRLSAAGLTEIIEYRK